MRHFLAKLDASVRFGRGIARPQSEAEWEGDTVDLRPARRIDGGKAVPIKSGDRLTLWTHEGAAYGSGYGLTADAVAAVVEQVGGRLHVLLADVRLLRPHISLAEIPRGTSGSDAIEGIRTYTLDQLVELTREQSAAFDRFTDKAIKQKLDRIAAENLSRATPLARAINDEVDLIPAAYDRQLAMHELRPEQAAFRDKLLDLYSGRCVISRTAIPETLEAAHIVPFARDIARRDDPANGLLLRADLHRLFDRLQLTINPDSTCIVVSPKLADTPYGRKFSNVIIRHYADVACLAEHRAAFRRLWGI